MIRCVVFDVDDTLFLERDYVRSGFAVVGRVVDHRFGISAFGDRCWSLFLGGARGNIFNRACRDMAVPETPELLSELVEIYRGHEPDIALTSDAAQLLPEVANSWIGAAVTDGPAASQGRKVRALGLDRWLSPVVLTAELGPHSGKPSPDAFRLIESRHAVSGSECVYVGDNPVKDFIGPRGLGWRTVRIRRTGGLHVDVPSGGDVDFEIEDLLQLTPALQSL